MAALLAGTCGDVSGRQRSVHRLQAVVSSACVLCLASIPVVVLPVLHALLLCLVSSLQAQLAQMINEKPQLINEYESGKAIPNPQVRAAAGRV